MSASEPDTIESENEMEIPGCSKDLFLLFLDYLYNGEVDIREVEDAIELYVLSDRYQENNLSISCLEVVARGLNDTIAIELLVKVDGLGICCSEGCLHGICGIKLWKIRKEYSALSSPSQLFDCGVAKGYWRDLFLTMIPKVLSFATVLTAYQKMIA